MIARFLNEGLVQTLDFSKMKTCDEFYDKFPDCRGSNTASLWTVMNNFRHTYNLPPIRYVAGKDWAVFGAVRKISNTIADLVFEFCYCPEKGDGRARIWRSRTFESPNYTNTDKNLKELRKSVESGLRMLSSVRDYDKALDLIEKMFYNETRWKINISY